MKKNKSTQEPETNITASSSGTPIVGHGAQLADSIPNYSDLVKVYGNQFGTSGYGVIHAPAVAPAGDVDGNDKWFAACESGSAEPEKLLAEGLEKLNKEVALLNSFMSLARRDEAKRAITIGKMLNTLQALARKAKLKWGAWCAEHVTFMSQRNIEKYMRLASRVDAHKHDYLGVDRSDYLCSATKSDVGIVDDPIGVFMAKHKLSFSPDVEFNFDDFIFNVDVALNVDRLMKNGLGEADIALVREMTRKQRKFDGAMLQDLKYIKKSGGDINIHLRDLTINRESELVPEVEKRPKAFNDMSARLVQTIDYVIRDPEQIDKVDPGLFQTLLKKLLLLEKAKFGVVEYKAA